MRNAAGNNAQVPLYCTDSNGMSVFIVCYVNIHPAAAALPTQSSRRCVHPPWSCSPQGDPAAQHDQYAQQAMSNRRVVPVSKHGTPHRRRDSCVVLWLSLSTTWIQLPGLSEPHATFTHARSSSLNYDFTIFTQVRS